MIQAQLEASRTLTILLVAIASISLVVGGIGIMNVMLVSVTERTREIGVRVSVGATEEAIRLQFLGESVFLSLLGGAVGVLLGIVDFRVHGSCDGMADARSRRTPSFSRCFSRSRSAFSSAITPLARRRSSTPSRPFGMSETAEALPDVPSNGRRKKAIAAGATLLVVIVAVLLLRRGDDLRHLTAKVEKGGIRDVVDATGTVNR